VEDTTHTHTPVFPPPCLVLRSSAPLHNAMEVELLAPESLLAHIATVRQAYCSINPTDAPFQDKLHERLDCMIAAKMLLYDAVHPSTYLTTMLSEHMNTHEPPKVTRDLTDRLQSRFVQATKDGAFEPAALYDVVLALMTLQHLLGDSWEDLIAAKNAGTYATNFNTVFADTVTRAAWHRHEHGERYGDAKAIVVITDPGADADDQFMMALLIKEVASAFNVHITFFTGTSEVFNTAEQQYAEAQQVLTWCVDTVSHEAMQNVAVYDYKSTAAPATMKADYLLVAAPISDECGYTLASFLAMTGVHEHTLKMMQGDKGRFNYEESGSALKTDLSLAQYDRNPIDAADATRAWCVVKTEESAVRMNGATMAWLESESVGLLEVVNCSISWSLRMSLCFMNPSGKPYWPFVVQSPKNETQGGSNWNTLRGVVHVITGRDMEDPAFVDEVLVELVARANARKATEGTA